jgi:hypothetical protein
MRRLIPSQTTGLASPSLVTLKPVHGTRSEHRYTIRVV